VIFRIDEDRVVGAGGHAGFATDADRLIEIDDAVRAFEHRGRRASRDTGRVGALVATCYLVRAAHLRPDADVNVLDVSTRDADRNDVLGLTGCRARVTSNAARVVDYLRPLHLISVSCFWLNHVCEAANITDLKCAGRVPICLGRRRRYG
jgi:hypothetical protein